MNRLFELIYLKSTLIGLLNLYIDLKYRKSENSRQTYCHTTYLKRTKTNLIILYIYFTMVLEIIRQ